MHGVGEWEPEIILTSLSNFLDALGYLLNVASQDSARIKPDDQTISDESKIREIKAKITGMCGSNEFWDSFFEDYCEWLEGFDV